MQHVWREEERRRDEEKGLQILVLIHDAYYCLGHPNTPKFFHFGQERLIEKESQSKAFCPYRHSSTLHRHQKQHAKGGVPSESLQMCICFEKAA